MPVPGGHVVVSRGELEGGYRTTDLRTSFAQLGVLKPKISSVSVDSGHDAAGSDATKLPNALKPASSASQAAPTLTA